MAVQDDSSVALIPSAYGTSKVYSVIPSNGNGDFDFTRSGNATRVNKGGYIETMGSNVPRLDYPLIDGIVQDCPALLLEPQRTNISPDSERMDLWLSLRVTRTTNQGVSPDGANTAVKVAMTATTGEHSVYDGVSVSSGTAYTNSIFIKRGTGSADWQYFQFRFRNGGFGTGGGVVVDIHNGKITYNSGLTDYGIENYGNGWYRVFITQTATTTSSSAGPVLAFNEISNGYDVSIVGNTNADVLLWGSQFEAGSYATSYIPTSGSTATRSADVCNGSGTSAEFNDSEGVLFAETFILANDGTFKFISLSNDNTNHQNVVWIYYRSDTNEINFRVVAGGSSSFDDIYTINDATLNAKLALKYKENDFSVWVNGFEVLTDTSGSTFSSGTLTTLEFNRPDDLNNFYGKTKQLMTFKTALTDSELETLTSWDSFNAMAKGQLYTIE